MAEACGVGLLADTSNESDPLAHITAADQLTRRFPTLRKSKPFMTARAVTVGVIASVIMPSESLWRRAAFEMQSPLANAMRVSPFSTLSVPSVPMVFYAGLYMAIALAVAVRRFSQRDL